MKAEISTASWLYEYPDRSAKLSVDVRSNGDIWIKGVGDDVIIIDAKDVREAYWLADALVQAGELSKKRPLDA